VWFDVMMRPRLDDDTEQIYFHFTAQLKRLEKNINDQRLRRGKKELEPSQFEWRRGPNTYDKSFIFKKALECLQDNPKKLDKNKYIREVD